MNTNIQEIFHDDIQYEKIVSENLKNQKEVKSMDYQAELERLKKNEAENSGDFWKPKAGQYRVKALSEIEEAKPYIEEGKEPQPRKQVRLLLNNQEVIWTMPHGLTPASSYGQLINLAASKGKLQDEEFTIVVTGSDKSKRFTIVV